MTIEDDIITWALTRAGWQQEVLVNLADGQQYDEAGIGALVDEILAGTNLAPTNEAKRISVKAGVSEQVQLTAISELKGVNALLDGQSLSIAPTGMTVIYGDNGSGKSGYARLVKAVVSARHRSEILPNVFAQALTKPSAIVSYSVAGTTRRHDLPDIPPPELQKMAFYDVQCGSEYVSRESTISYRPSALTLLDGLIGVCDAVRAEITARRQLNESQTLDLGIDAGTKAGLFLGSLSAKCTEEQVREATALPEGSNDLLAAVLTEEARLSGSDPQKEKVRLTLLAQKVGTLASELKSLTDSLSKEKAKSYAEARVTAVRAREAARIAAAQSFDSEPLDGIGSETWRTLWVAARAYSTAEAYHDHDFPVTGDDSVCVLCQQTLDENGKARLQRFDQFMTDTTERDAKAAEKAFESAVSSLTKLTFATPTRHVTIAELEDVDATLSSSVAPEIERLEKYRDDVLSHLLGTGALPNPLPTSSVAETLSTLASTLAGQAASTDVAQYQKRLRDVRVRKSELQSNVRLSEAVQRIKDEIVRLKKLDALIAARSAADTSSITHKSSALTRTYATQEILDRFTRETERLMLRSVTLEDRGGRKGKLNQRPGLLGAIHKADAWNVLSEGEQTALGLAGFFTEAVFDASKSGLVFDDPVTSLDHVRRPKVASRLVELAADRQVVVFTHDVVFAGKLCSAAIEQGVPLAERTIQRHGLTPGACSEELPWKAKDFGRRKNHLRVTLDSLKKERSGLPQDAYEERVASWAGYLSETWEGCATSEVLNQVFDRATSETHVKKFRLISMITETDNNELQSGYSASSRWVRRHNKAIEDGFVAPEPEELEVEYQRLIDWRARVKNYLN